MRAGKLKHRVALQQSTETTDEYGQPVQVWTTVATVWAQREDLSGREYFTAQQTQAEVTTRYRIRYRRGITPLMRLVEGSETFDIVAVQDPDGQRHELQLLCKRVI